MMIQIPWDAAKAILRGHFRETEGYFVKQKKSCKNKPPNLMPKAIRKRKKKKLKVNRRK